MKNDWNKVSVFYPAENTKTEERLEPSVEISILDLKEERGKPYFFSSHFKLSEYILEAVTKGYLDKRKKTKLLNISGKGERVSFRDELLNSGEINTELIKEIRFLNDEQKELEVLSDIMMFYKDKKGNIETTFILTKHTFYSDFMVDDEPYIELPIQEIMLDGDDRIIKSDGSEIQFDSSLPKDFVDFFHELKILGSEVRVPNTKHPLRKQSRNIRKNFLEILVAKCLEDGNLSSNEVVRLEIIARQFGIGSQEVLEIIRETWSDRTEYNDVEYIKNALSKIRNIDDPLRCVLYHDVLILDIMSKKNKIEEYCESEFTNELIKKTKLSDEFAKKYKTVMQKFVSCAYEIRNTVGLGNYLIKDNSIVENIMDTIDYEYVVQENSIWRD